MITEPRGATMNYLIKVSVDPDRLLQNFADSQGICIKDVDLSIEDILEQEISTALDASQIYILNLEEV